MERPCRTAVGGSNASVDFRFDAFQFGIDLLTIVNYLFPLKLTPLASVMLHNFFYWVGVLWDADGAGTDIGFKEYQAAASALKIQLQAIEVRGPEPDFEGAFRTQAKGRTNALIAIRGGLSVRYRKQIADLAPKSRLPSMFEGSDFVEAGGLASYSANLPDMQRRAAYYVDRILSAGMPRCTLSLGTESNCRHEGRDFFSHGAGEEPGLFYCANEVHMENRYLLS